MLLKLLYLDGIQDLRKFIKWFLIMLKSSIFIYMFKILFDVIYYSLQQIVVLVEFEAMWQLKKRVPRIVTMSPSSIPW